MKQILKFIKLTIQDISNKLLEALISAIYPIVEALLEINKILIDIIGIQHSIINSFFKENIKNLKKILSFHS